MTSPINISRHFLGYKKRLAWMLGIILVAGFLITNSLAYLAASNEIRTAIATQELPLTSDSVYSEVQRDILRPVLISIHMGQNTFLRDWLLAGEKNTPAMLRYLKAIKEKYGTITAFLISDNTHKYYYADGILKTVSPDEKRDAWYFRSRTLATEYEINIDNDATNKNTMTIFVNYRMHDYQNRFIGITGVGLTLNKLTQQIEKYENKFSRNIYFLDQQGNAVLAGKMPHPAGSIRQWPGVGQVADRILTKASAPVSLEYFRDDESGAQRVQLISRFIPELGWYLVVERDEVEAVKPLRQAFYVNLGISIIATILVLMMTLFAIRFYQRRVEQLAITDALTGLDNRHATEFQFERAVSSARRNRTPLSLVLIDIDRFKDINDQFGHLKGDEVIREIAQTLRGLVRTGDAIARWGGEEFLIVLNNCAQAEAVALAEKLRAAVENKSFNLTSGSMNAPLNGSPGSEPAQTKITISAGVTQHDLAETDDACFARADKALYQAKQAGRNRVESATAPPIPEKDSA
jgi:diguanylate cyclase (GGDEF)-like protein